MRRRIHILPGLLIVLFVAVYIPPCRAEHLPTTSPHSLAQEASANALFPRGDRLPLGFYSVAIEDFQRVKEAGCTFVGPYYGTDQLQYLKAAERVGLKFLYSVGHAHTSQSDETGTGQKAATPNLRKLRKAIAEQMQPVLENPALNQTVAWWYLKPEELRHWQKDEMSYLDAVAIVVRDLDPAKRPVWMYEPNHRSASELAKTGKHLDVIGKGTYVNTGKTSAVSTSGIPHAWVRWSIDQELEAIRSLETNAGKRARRRTPIAVLEMSQDFTTESQQRQIAEYVRHDVYLSLISGAKGVAVWSAARRSGFQSHEQFLSAYLSAFNELTGTEGLDKVLLFGHWADQLRIKITDGPPQLSLAVKVGKHVQDHVYASVAHLDVIYESERYLFLVNSAEQNVKVDVYGLPATELRGQEVFHKVPARSVQNNFSTELAPLEVQVWKFQSSSRQAANTRSVGTSEVEALELSTPRAPDG